MPLELDPVALATLIFAAMAGLGSVVRIYQNKHLWKHHTNLSVLSGSLFPFLNECLRAAAIAVCDDIDPCKPYTTHGRLRSSSEQAFCPDYTM